MNDMSGFVLERNKLNESMNQSIKQIKSIKPIYIIIIYIYISIYIAADFWIFVKLHVSSPFTSGPPDPRPERLRLPAEIKKWNSTVTSVAIPVSPL